MRYASKTTSKSTSKSSSKASAAAKKAWKTRKRLYGASGMKPATKKALTKIKREAQTKERHIKISMDHYHAMTPKKRKKMTAIGKMLAQATLNQLDKHQLKLHKKMLTRHRLRHEWSKG